MFTSYIIYTNPSINRVVTMPYLVNRGSDYDNTGNVISWEQEEHIKKE